MPAKPGSDLRAEAIAARGFGCCACTRSVLALEPKSLAVVVDEDYLDAIAAAYGEVVDAKSPFTAGRSQRVGEYTDLIAQWGCLQRGGAGYGARPCYTTCRRMGAGRPGAAGDGAPHAAVSGQRAARRQDWPDACLGSALRLRFW